MGKTGECIPTEGQGARVCVCVCVRARARARTHARAHVCLSVKQVLLTTMCQKQCKGGSCCSLVLVSGLFRDLQL